MKWFGKGWGAPCCEPGDHVATPEGQLCVRCEKPIEADAQGFVLPLMKESGATMVPYHHACLLASVLPCPGCEHCRPGGDIRDSPLGKAFAAGLTPMFVPGGTAEAVDVALKIARDLANRAITCSCGVVYLSGAAEKDEWGHPLCIDCGAPA